MTFEQAYGTGSPPCAPTRPGLGFGGWWTGDDGTWSAVIDVMIVATASNHVGDARWTATAFTISFDAQGGATPSPASLIVTFGASYGALPTTSRAGYAFGGWWTTPAAREVTYGGAYGALCAPTRTGCAFGGWHLGDGGTGEAVSATSIVSTASNHVLCGVA